jgi:hypothetical protein
VDAPCASRCLGDWARFKTGDRCPAGAQQSGQCAVTWASSPRSPSSPASYRLVPPGPVHTLCTPTPAVRPVRVVASCGVYCPSCAEPWRRCLTASTGRVGPDDIPDCGRRVAHAEGGAIRASSRGTVATGRAAAGRHRPRHDTADWRGGMSSSTTRVRCRDGGSPTTAGRTPNATPCRSRRRTAWPRRRNGV